MSYTTVKEVVGTSGTYKPVNDLETVGTGNGTTTSFSLAKNPVVEGSEKIYSDGTLLTTGYSVNYTTGLITFTTAPALNKVITATYWVFEGVTMDSDIVTDKISAAEAWLEEYTDRKWESTEVENEKYDGNDQSWLLLKNFPIISVQELTVGSTSVTTTKIYVYETEGRINLASDAEATKFTNTAPQCIDISYTYGYNPIPAKVKTIVRNIAAVDVIASVIGATYADITSWQVGEVSSSFGQPYMNLKAAADQLQQSTMKMLNNIKKKVAIE
jgi:hypothetical protein